MKRTAEEKARKEAADIDAAVEAWNLLKDAALGPIGKLKHKLADFILRFKRRKESAKSEEAEKEEPAAAPQLFFISSDGGTKTPFDDKIEEARWILSGEERPYLPQLYKIEGVDLAEEEPAQWPKENPTIPKLAIGGVIEPRPDIAMIGTREGEREEIIPISHEVKNGLARISESLGKVGLAFSSMTAAVVFLAGALCEYEKQRAAVFENYPNKRVVHLAKHAKKERVRKKNLNRINEWYERGRH